MVIGFGLKKTVFLGEASLQEHIYEQTNAIKVKLQEEGFMVNQSHIIGDLWVACNRFRDFVLLAKITNATIIYIHWKSNYLNQPVFFFLQDSTAIIYEPF